MDPSTSIQWPERGQPQRLGTEYRPGDGVLVRWDLRFAEGRRGKMIRRAVLNVYTRSAHDYQMRVSLAALGWRSFAELWVSFRAGGPEPACSVVRMVVKAWAEGRLPSLPEDETSRTAWQLYTAGAADAIAQRIHRTLTSSTE